MSSLPIFLFNSPILNTNLSIELLQQEHINCCLRISAEVFGLDYHHPLNFDLFNKDHYYLVAKKNNKVIGFSILLKLSKKEMEKITEDHLKLTFPSYYLIDVIAISQKEQKKGIGTAILQKILTKIDAKLPLYSIAWKDKYGINIEKLFNNHNIKSRINLGRVWAHGCNEKFKCNSYNIHCRCEGVLFKLN